MEKDELIQALGVFFTVATVTLGFNLSPGGRPISVLVRGTLDTVDLKGDRFLRSTLGLPSTLVRTTGF